MRFHVVGLPHVPTAREYSQCAYTGKVLRFCRMMKSLGHDVFHYGAEGSEVECTEHVTVITAEQQRGSFGEYDPQKLPRVEFDVNRTYWRRMNRRAVEEIKRRQQHGDFLCLIAGVCQEPIARHIGESRTIAVEYGIGYYGTFAKYRVFESYTHQAAVYGTVSRDPNGSLYDCVIPNYFDPEDFEFSTEKQDYLLFLARVVQRKGIQIAMETAAAAEVPLIVAGPGIRERRPERLELEEGTAIPIPEGISMKCIGGVGVEERATLMRNARAIIQPTIYLEPFGGCVVEAALCGTPAITTDYAAFSETVRHGVTGYRCHTLEQFAWAARAVKDLDPAEIRRLAVANYSIDRVRHMYQEYFEMLSGLWREGWPELRERAQLDWLTKAA